MSTTPSFQDSLIGPAHRAVLLVALLLTSIVPAAANCLHGETMGSTWRVVAPHLGAEARPALCARIEALLESVNARMSTYRPDSELSRFNASASMDWQPVSAELLEVLAAARRVSEASDGAFDVTVGPLVDLWGFGPQARIDAPPSGEAIAAARARVGYRQVELDETGSRVRKLRADVRVDLSALAEGWAVDQVVKLLEAEGLVDFLVDVGGEMRVRGRNADGLPWRLGVALPRADSDATLRALTPGDAAVATSGDYRNYFEHDGRHYSHEIDPASGAPIVNDVASVTVIARECVYADAYATAFMVLGVERGLALARRVGVQALFVLRGAQGFELRASPGFPQR
ncbi:MAG: FAD:protein FMN transferase [Gammaproteobacteria bacterium]|nr:FAD:protein FMN transferase [Gammaproteobacteria bacterium]